jgi:hypothetical protein
MMTFKIWLGLKSGACVFLAMVAIGCALAPPASGPLASTLQPTKAAQQAQIDRQRQEISAPQPTVANPQQREAPVNAAPAPAPPTATPMSLQALGEGALQALMRQDFNAYRQYYAPDNQPSSWEDAIGSGSPKVTQLYFNAAIGCRDVGYTVTERSELQNGMLEAIVVINFASDCARIPAFGSNPAMSLNQWSFEFERANDERAEEREAEGADERFYLLRSSPGPPPW